MKKSKKRTSGEKISIIATIVFSIVGGIYVLYVGRSLILPPKVTFDNIKDGTAFEYPLVILEGQTKRTEKLFINGLSVVLTPEGTFTHDILLSPGSNTIIVNLQDHFSVKKTQKYVLFCRYPCKPYVEPKDKNDDEPESTQETTKPVTSPIDSAESPRDNVSIINSDPEESVRNSSQITDN